MKRFRDDEGEGCGSHGGDGRHRREIGRQARKDAAGDEAQPEADDQAEAELPDEKDNDVRKTV